MVDTKNITIGVLLLTILAGGVGYVLFQDAGLKIRVDEDKATFYVINENNRWIVGGREYTSIFEGTSKLYRARSKVSIDYFYWNATLGEFVPLDQNIENYPAGEFKIVRTTPYQRGPTVIDTWVFDGSLTDIEMFPVEHTVRVLNGEGFFLRYEAKDLHYDGQTYKLSDELVLRFGYDMKVSLHPGYRWGWVYQTGTVRTQYDILSDDETFTFKLFDPISTYVAYWPFTSTVGANDVSGNDQHGTSYATISGGVVTFDGTDDYIVVSDSATIDPAGSEFAVSFWFNWSDNSSNGFVFDYGKLSNQGVGLLAYSPTNSLFFYQNGAPCWTTSGTFYDSSWHHYVAVYTTAGGWVLYQDGNTISLGGTCNSGTNINSTTNNLFFGRNSGGGDYLAGQLDEIKWYKESLNSSEVSSLYALGRPDSVAAGVPATINFSSVHATINDYFYGTNTHGIWGGVDSRIDTNGDGTLNAVSNYTWHREKLLDAGLTVLRGDAHLDAFNISSSGTWATNTASNFYNINMKRNITEWAYLNNLTVVWIIDGPPQFLANTSSGCTGYWTCAPLSWDDYANVALDFINYVTANGTYASAVVAEIWNEPYSQLMPSATWAARTEAYNTGYNITRNKIKQEYPNMLVGGPSGYFGNADREEMMRSFVYNLSGSYDFISIHEYLNEPMGESLRDSCDQLLTWHITAGGSANTFNCFITEYGVSDSNKKLSYVDTRVIIGETLALGLIEGAANTSLQLYQWMEETGYQDVAAYDEYPNRWEMVSEPGLNNTLYELYNISTKFATYHPSGANISLADYSQVDVSIVASSYGGNKYITIVNAHSDLVTFNFTLSGTTSTTLRNTFTLDEINASGGSFTVTSNSDTVDHYYVVESSTPGAGNYSWYQDGLEKTNRTYESGTTITLNASSDGNVTHAYINSSQLNDTDGFYIVEELINGSAIFSIPVTDYYTNIINNSTFVYLTPENCYQETVNESVGCGGLNTGTYYTFNSTSLGYISSGYMKPPTATSAIVTARYAENYWYNDTLPSVCWDGYDDRIYFLLGTVVQGTSGTNTIRCHTGTSWYTMAATPKIPRICIGDVPTYDLSPLYDGDWNTGMTINPSGDWVEGCEDTLYLYEEAVTWVLDSDTLPLQRDSWEVIDKLILNVSVNESNKVKDMGILADGGIVKRLTGTVVGDTLMTYLFSGDKSTESVFFSSATESKTIYINVTTNQLTNITFNVTEVAANSEPVEFWDQFGIKPTKIFTDNTVYSSDGKAWHTIYTQTDINDTIDSVSYEFRYGGGGNGGTRLVFTYNDTTTLTTPTLGVMYYGAGQYGAYEIASYTHPYPEKNVSSIAFQVAVSTDWWGYVFIRTKTGLQLVEKEEYVGSATQTIPHIILDDFTTNRMSVSAYGDYDINAYNTDDYWEISSEFDLDPTSSTMLSANREAWAVLRHVNLQEINAIGINYSCNLMARSTGNWDAQASCGIYVSSEHTTTPAQILLTEKGVKSSDWGRHTRDSSGIVWLYRDSMDDTSWNVFVDDKFERTVTIPSTDPTTYLIGRTHIEGRARDSGSRSQAYAQMNITDVFLGGFGGEFVSNNVVESNFSIMSNVVHSTTENMTGVYFSADIYNDRGIDFYVSADNGTNWQFADIGFFHLFNTPGTELKWMANGTNLGTTPYGVTSVQLDVVSSVPSNVTMSIAYGNVISYNDTGNFTGPKTITLSNTSEFETYVNTLCDGEDTCLIPIVLTSDSIGGLLFSGLSTVSELNPVTISSGLTPTSVISASVTENYTVTLSDYKLYLNGDVDNISFDIGYGVVSGDSYSWLATETAHINARYSPFILKSVTSFLDFFPSSFIEYNIEPYGQNSTRPFWNATSENTNHVTKLYVNTYESLPACATLKINTVYNSSTSTNLTSSGANLVNLTAGSTQDFWHWLDFVSCTTMFDLDVVFNSLCADCVVTSDYDYWDGGAHTID
jgi:hypothetical protein